MPPTSKSADSASVKSCIVRLIAQGYANSQSMDMTALGLGCVKTFRNGPKQFRVACCGFGDASEAPRHHS